MNLLMILYNKKKIIMKMKKFSDLVKESNQISKYKFTANIDIEGVVNAYSDGDAGETIDKLIDEIAGIAGNVTNYNINNIEPLMPEIKENILNDDIDVQVNNAFNEITRLVEDSIALMTDYHKAMLLEKLRMYLNNK